MGDMAMGNIGGGPSVDQFKSMFFDSKLVLRKVNRALKQKLSRFGAFVRQRWRSSIRKRKAVSAPGSPPSSHTDLLRKFVLFGYEPDRQSVVIGPALLAKRNRRAVPLSGTVPETIERGGDVKIIGPRKSRIAHYRARPAGQPAYDAELPKFLDSLKDSVT